MGIQRPYSGAFEHGPISPGCQCANNAQLIENVMPTTFSHSACHASLHILCVCSVLMIVFLFWGVVFFLFLVLFFVGGYMKVLNTIKNYFLERRRLNGI